MKAPPSLGVRRARKEAQALLRRFRIRDAADLEVNTIAQLIRARVETGGIDGAQAQLARVGRFATIRVNDRIAHPGARRFSVAHELGHLLLKHRSPNVDALCDAPAVHAHLDPGAEAEANAFASELLMPEPLVRRRCEVSPVSLAHPRALATDFRVSLMAAALRFVELTSERCALVFAKDRRVVWAARSATFAPFIERKRPIDRASVAADWFGERRVVSGCQPVPADAWLDCDGADKTEIWEEAVPLPEMTGVMSLLWIRESDAGPLDRA